MSRQPRRDLEALIMSLDARELADALAAAVDRLGEHGADASGRLVPLLRERLAGPSGPYVEEGLAELGRVLKSIA